MKLFGGHTSPFVRHCRIALLQEGLDFEFVEVDATAISQQSPTTKVPYFSDGDLVLSDSSSIIKYVREKAGKSFLSDIHDFELYTMSNTLVDSTLNVFILENEGFDQHSIKYIAKQKSRIEKGLSELDMRINPETGIEQDSALRCACFIDWALFRNRLDISTHQNLGKLLDHANSIEVFSSTAPF